jgi:hypothetical protein
VNPRYPDFNYKKPQDALWLRDRRNPPWVAAELATIAPGIVQFDSFSWNRRLVRDAKTGGNGAFQTNATKRYET